MVEMRRARTRMKSLRSLIAIGGAAAMALGVAQATGTMANPADAVNSTGAQVATGNFYPTPLPSTASCGNSGTAGFRSATISWPSAGAGMKYRVVVVRNNNEIMSDTFETGLNKKFNFSRTAQTFIARVYTVNIASGATDATRKTSSGWIGQGIYTSTTSDTYCSGGLSNWAVNELWEDTNIWDPTTPAPNGQSPLSRSQPPTEEDAIGVDKSTSQAPSTSETAEPTTSTEPTSTTTTPGTTTPGTTTPDATTPDATTPDATTSPETTPTEAPKLVLTDTVESGGLTAGWTVGGNKVAVVDADGNELASGRVEAGSTLHWNNGQLWIVGGAQVYRIMESPQDGKWKFYTDSGQNMPDFG
ncbi:hypothetical protein [Rhodococcus sp. IEGM 1379]|uniref:hypothetical protein n=1 Tax=Rhodococcus sp. IEGM 1379 TaxID=3047086 RepID=UPI0024B63B22|nr:hypothetical protein [Rhodococcus sp. IEGM 1379]MDI9917167.1 hypothetical protein [Rhodococcus sp. IEGM 1379]